MSSALGSLASIGSLPSLGSTTSATGVGGSGSGSSFGDLLTRNLDGVSALEGQADALTSQFAAGGNVQISDLMAATSKANLSMTVVNEIRNRGLEAYQSIINIQV